MAKIRDLSQAQFDAAAKRLGFEPVGLFGYFRLPNCTTEVSVYNAGSNRRAQLAYLIAKAKEYRN